MSRPTALLGASLTLCGCLVPAPVEEEEVLPNYPPSFAPERVTPPFEQAVLYDPQVSTEPIDFSIPLISDVDTEDRIYWRWFRNYDARFNKDIFAQGPTAGSGGAEITFSLSPCQDLASFEDRTLHQLTVVVADRPFLDKDDPATPNRTLPADAGHFQITWFVSFDVTACPSVP